jgi:hypothetical protein
VKLIHSLSLITLLALSPLRADMIGLNFTYTATTRTPDTLFGPSVTAGAPGYEQANWNHMQGDWSGNVENDALFTAGIRDSNGSVVSGSGLLSISYSPHADPVHFDSNNTWASNSGNTTADHTLMNGYLDDGTDNQPYLNLSLAPGFYPTYSVVLYINGDSPTLGTGRYWLESWTNPLAEGTVITDRIGVAALSTGPGTFTGTYTQAGGTAFGPTGSPTNLDVAAGHYLVFTGITARNVRIRGAGNDDPEDFGRGPLNAVQIVNIVPEPQTALLLGVGLVSLRRLFRRR